MLGCHGCQEQMLEHLYDLLEGAERGAFLDHLTGCVACQSALEKARAQQNLLATAARLSFPQVIFTLPGKSAARPSAAAAPEPAILPLPRPKQPPRRRWQPRWVAAAAILLLTLGGLSILGHDLHRDHVAAQETLAAKEQAVADARLQAEQARDQLRAAGNERDSRIASIHDAARSRELRLVVSGPRNVQPGAPAEFLVRAVDLNDRPAAADIIASITDQHGQKTEVPTASATYTAEKHKADVDKKEAAKETPLGKPDGLSVMPMAAGLYKVTIPPTLNTRTGQPLSLFVSARAKAAAPNRPPIVLQGAVQLSAPVYLTHLTTDKPMYQPGDTVHFRSLTLERDTLAPPSDDFFLRYTLTTPKGEQRELQHGLSLLRRNNAQQTLANGPDQRPIRGVGAGDAQLPDDAPGGEYTLTVTEGNSRFAPVSRRFIVNRYQLPRLNKKLEFNRSTYGPGDEVQASVSATRAEGGVVSDCPVDVTVNIDGANYDASGMQTQAPFQAKTDADGRAVLRFRLPPHIERGQASLSVRFLDATKEAILRPIPVVLKKVQLELFPEGGDLVVGLPNRVYFQARTPLGKPAQISATLFEDETALPVSIATLSDDKLPGVNQGMGAFRFTPRAGKRYSLRIDSPAGIEQRFPLPEIKTEGVVMSIPGGVFQPGQTIPVEVRSTRQRPLMVGAYCRGHLLDTVMLAKGQTTAELRPTTDAGGVCRVTVFEEVPTGQTQRMLKPVAERLIYRVPTKIVDVAIAPDKRRYTPGEKVSLTLLATNEKEKATPAIVMLSVVDSSVITLADDKTDRTMPTHFLLTSEVRRADDLEYADFMLSGYSKALETLDLLLGTQGWRRFAEQNADVFRNRLREETFNLPQAEQQRRTEDAERLLMLLGQSSQTTDPDQQSDMQKLQKANDDFAEKEENLRRQHEDAVAAVTRAADDPEYKAALATLNRFSNLAHHLRTNEAPALLGCVLTVLGALVLASVGARRPRQAWTLAGAMAGCVGLFVLAGREPIPESASLPGMSQDVADLGIPNAPLDPEEEQFKKGRGGPVLAHDDRAEEKGEERKFPGERLVAPLPVLPPPVLPQVQPGAEFVPQPLQPLPAPAVVPVMAQAPEPQRQMGLDPVAKQQIVQPKASRPADAFLRPNPAGMEGGSKGGAANKARVALRDELREFRGANGVRRATDQQGGQRIGGGGGFFDRNKGEGKAAEFGFMAEPLVVREYAHTRSRMSEFQNLRSDFTETVYWHPVLVLPDGKAEVSFQLSDSVTTFQVTAFAHTVDGRVGSTVKKLESRQPLTLSPRVPTEVTATDQLEVPIIVGNSTGLKRDVQVDLLAHSGLKMEEGESASRLTLEAETLGRLAYRFRPAMVQGTATVQVAGKSTGGFQDAIRETIRVVPDGFPVSGSSSDLLEKSVTHKLTLPKWLPGTLSVKVDVYPSTLADLQRGLESLLREPSGCFEQSSTSNYPNVLILDYLKATDKSAPEVEKKARELLDRGYQKLVGFECQEAGKQSRKGYEWFGGQVPPHEALTAYGLLQFRDMAKVHQVDGAMLERTRSYLLAQRDNAGGFNRNPRALDTFGRAPEHITNAYIVWAITESGSDDVSKELETLAKQAKDSPDPYFLSLTAISLANRDRKPEATEILQRVAKMQKDTGHLDARQTSITGSGGQSLQIETTALATLGWLKTDPQAFDAPIRKAVRWIGTQRSEYGGFGSTQSTILALKALIAHARANKRTPEAGQLRLFVGATRVAEMNFPAGVDRPLQLALPNAEKHLKPGANKLRVEITGEKNIFPHTLGWECRTVQPPSAKDCPVELTTTLAKTQLSEGESVRLTVRVKNVSGQGQGMATAVVGLPAGLILPEDLKQLKEHCRLPENGERALVSAFEVRGREVVLYWRDLAKDQVIEVPVDLIARSPGEYRGPASRAYLYYTPERKHWVAPLRVRIAPEIVTK